MTVPRGGVTNPDHVGDGEGGGLELPCSESSLVVGTEIRVVTCLGETFTGTVFTVDPVTGSVVLKMPHPHTVTTCSLRLFMRSALESIETIATPNTEGISDDGDAATHMMQAVSEKELEAKERKALIKAEKTLAQINKNAGPNGQATFDALVKTMDCVWDGQNIEVYGQVVITAPYGVEGCKLKAGPADALDRVRKVLEFHIAGCHKAESKPVVSSQ
eukprot:52659_1